MVHVLANRKVVSLVSDSPDCPVVEIAIGWDEIDDILSEIETARVRYAPKEVPNG